MPFIDLPKLHGKALHSNKPVALCVHGDAIVCNDCANFETEQISTRKLNMQFYLSNRYEENRERI